MPYYDRVNQLEETLCSFVSLYQRNDFEIIIVEDTKQTEQMSNELKELLNQYIFKNLRIKHIKSNGIKNFSPSTQFNEGVFVCHGDYLIITNPECKHEVDILGGLDLIIAENPNDYIICGCASLNKDGLFDRWYQHSVHRNKKYHFCSCISRKNFNAVKGFNEDYSIGYGYDDDSFRDRVIYSGIHIICCDDLLVSHLWHEKLRPNGYRSLLNRNKRLYEKETRFLKSKGSKTT